MIAHVVDGRHVREAVHAVGQQRRGHQLQHRVLRTGDDDLPVQGRGAANHNPVGIHGPKYGPCRRRAVTDRRAAVAGRRTSSLVACPAANGRCTSRGRRAQMRRSMPCDRATTSSRRWSSRAMARRRPSRSTKAPSPPTSERSSNRRPPSRRRSATGSSSHGSVGCSRFPCAARCATGRTTTASRGGRLPIG